MKPEKKWRRKLNVSISDFISFRDQINFQFLDTLILNFSHFILSVWNRCCDSRFLFGCQFPINWIISVVKLNIFKYHSDSIESWQQDGARFMFAVKLNVNQMIE